MAVFEAENRDHRGRMLRWRRSFSFCSAPGIISPGYVTLRTFLDDAAGLMDGTQVRLNGIPIGYLDAQKLTNSRNPNRKVEFDLKVKERYLREIPVDSVVGLASDNLLGDQYIGIRRGQSAEHVQPGAELATTQTQDITRMMAQMSQAAGPSAGRVHARQQIDGERGHRQRAPSARSCKIRRQAPGSSGELDQLMADIQHGHGTITKLFYEDPLDKQLESPLKQLNAVMASADSTSARLKEFKDGLDWRTARISSAAKPTLRQARARSPNSANCRRALTN